MKYQPLKDYLKTDVPPVIVGDGKAKAMVNLLHQYLPRLNRRDLRDILDDIDAGVGPDETKLAEEVLALLCGGVYTRTGGNWQDFSNGDDCKTCSVNENTRAMTIRSVQHKTGALRVIIYNPFKKHLDFMYIPLDAWKPLARPDGGKSYGWRVKVIWNELNDTYGALDRYRLKTIEELAMANCFELFK